MGIRKSTGLLAVLVVTLAVTSIGLLIALLLAKQQVSLSEPPRPINGHHRSDVPTGAPAISKDWEEEEPVEGVTDRPVEIATSPKPVEPDADLPVNPWEREIRMPKSVIPLHYDLYLFPDLNEGLFSGNSSVREHRFLLTNYNFRATYRTSRTVEEATDKHAVPPNAFVW